MDPVSTLLRMTCSVSRISGGSKSTNEQVKVLLIDIRDNRSSGLHSSLQQASANVRCKTTNQYQGQTMENIGQIYSQGKRGGRMMSFFTT